MGIGNNDGAWRRVRRNTVDMDVPARMSALAVRQPIVKSSGQAQRDTAAVKIDASTTLADLTLHIIGEALPKLSIALYAAPKQGHLPTIFLLISRNWKYSRREWREYRLNFKFKERYIMDSKYNCEVTNKSRDSEWISDLKRKWPTPEPGQRPLIRSIKFSPNRRDQFQADPRFPTRYRLF